MTDAPRHCRENRRAGDIRVAEYNPDRIEFGFLSAARYFFLAFSEGNSSAWMTAFLSADCFFPGEQGAEQMRLALALVHEMRTSRKSTFHFSNPRCQNCSAILTLDERYLLDLVRAARRGRRSAMASAALLLCEGNELDPVLKAATDFANGLQEARAYAFMTELQTPAMTQQ